MDGQRAGHVNGKLKKTVLRQLGRDVVRPGKGQLAECGLHGDLPCGHGAEADFARAANRRARFRAKTRIVGLPPEPDLGIEQQPAGLANGESSRRSAAGRSSAPRPHSSSPSKADSTAGSAVSKPEAILTL